MDKVDIATLYLPDEIIECVGNATVYESSGQSGMKTLYVDRYGGAYLKIADCGALHFSYTMQNFYWDHKLSSSVLCYLSTDRDYLIIESIKGEDGSSEKYIAEPEKLSEVFAYALHSLH